MRVFIDTNVWLAGRFGRGLCAELLDQLIAAGAELLLDERVLEEFRRIARAKLHVPQNLLAEAEGFFQHHTRVLPAAAHPLAGVPDADDAWILAAAVAAHADGFLTGDKALIALGAIEGMPILDPRTAYLKLRGLA